MSFPNRYLQRINGAAIDGIPATTSIGPSTSGQIVATGPLGIIDSSLLGTVAGGVTSVNGISGAMFITGSQGVTVTSSGQNITIGATASSGGVTTVNGASGAIIISGGSGIGVSASGGIVTVSVQQVQVPLLRGSNINSSNLASSITVTFPAGSAVGDLAIFFANSGYTPTTPAGWTDLGIASAGTWNACAGWKILTSGDIATGSMTVSNTGSSFDFVVGIAVFIGATGGIRETESSQLATSSLTNTTTSAVLNTDIAIYFASGRSGSAGGSIPVITPGYGASNILKSAVTSNTQSTLADQVMPGGVLSVVNSYPTTASAGCTAAQVIVKGVTTVGLGVTSINNETGDVHILAGPNVTVTSSGQNITIGATASSGGVTTVNGASGAITLAAGSGLTLATLGNTITLSASGTGGGSISGAYVQTVNSVSGAITLAGGSGISLSQTGNTITIAASGSGSIVTGAASAVALTTTTYLALAGGISSTTEASVDMAAPNAATINNLFVELSAAPGTGNTLTFALRKNGATQAVSVTITGSNISGSDLVHAFNCNQGDLLSISVVPTGTVVATPNIITSLQWGSGAGVGGGGNKTTLGTIASFISSPPVSPSTGDIFKPTDCNYEFIYSGSSWLSFFQGIPVALPPQSSWTWDNQGAATIDGTFAEQYMYAPRSAAVQLRTQWRTAPTAPYTITASIAHDVSGILDGTQGNTLAAGFGIGFRDGTGKCVSFLYILNPGPTWGIQTDKWTSASSYSASYKNNSSAGSADYWQSRNPAYLRIKDDGTNLIFSASIDRIHWVVFDTRSRTDFLTAGPTQIFWGAYPNQQGVFAALVDWTIS